MLMSGFGGLCYTELYVDRQHFSGGQRAEINGSRLMTDDIQLRIAQVRDDREHGSRWLVREAMLILRDLAQTKMVAQDELMRHLYAAARALAGARPAMAALSSAVSHILNVQGGPVAV